MPERIIVMRRGSGLVPVFSEGREALAKLPHNKELSATIVQPRNIKLHRKAFALAQLAFQYWEPESLITKTERDTVVKLGKFLVTHGLHRDTVRSLCAEFVGHLKTARQSVEAEKDFEAFREFITVQAGYYSVVHTPAGPKRVAKSWSFGSMDDTAFSAFYKAMFNACWKLVLSQHFESEEDAEAAMLDLLSFD